jgi:serine protease Do
MFGLTQRVAVNAVKAAFRALAMSLVFSSLSAAPQLAQAGLVELVVAAKPSVLAVGVFNATTSPRFTFRGTGFVVGDGQLVVTNAHVLPESADGAAGAQFGNQLRVLAIGPGAPQERVATVVKVDVARDLALLRIDGAPLPALSLASAVSVAEGKDVAFIGYPIGAVLGIVPVTHRGIVSAVTQAVLPQANSRVLSGRAAAQLREGSFPIYQLDATAYPGNSGGPLFDIETGHVIGVLNMVLLKGTRESALSQPSGISYAIPVRHVLDLLARP